MRAFILATDAPGATLDLARPIAGAPLLVRQLECLRATGVTHAVINRVASGKLPSVLHATELKATGVEVTWIPSAEPLTAVALAKRVASRDSVTVVVPHARLGAIDLRWAIALAESANTRVEARVSGLSVTIDRFDGTLPETTQALEADGWLIDVTNELCAHALTMDVLSGRRAGIEIRGSELSPGVWTGRGVVIDERAVVTGPCYFGAGVLVARCAHIGPDAVLGDGVVVERDAHIENARVGDGLVIGQGVTVESSYVSPGRLEPHGGEAIAIDDELLIGGRKSPRIFARVVAAAAYAALLPPALVAGGRSRAALGKLAQIIVGNGEWLGVRGAEGSAPVVDVEKLLVPPGAQDDERAAARALYRATKSFTLDAKLLLASVVGAGENL